MTPFVRQEPNRFALRARRAAALTADGTHWEWVGPVCTSQEHCDAVEAELLTRERVRVLDIAVHDDLPDDDPVQWARAVDDLTALYRVPFAP